MLGGRADKSSSDSGGWGGGLELEKANSRKKSKLQFGDLEVPLAAAVPGARIVPAEG